MRRLPAVLGIALTGLLLTISAPRPSEATVRCCHCQSLGGPGCPVGDACCGGQNCNVGCIASGCFVSCDSDCGTHADIACEGY
jgi:hypothetical protein